MFLWGCNVGLSGRPGTGDSVDVSREGANVAILHRPIGAKDAAPRGYIGARSGSAKKSCEFCNFSGAGVFSCQLNPLLYMNSSKLSFALIAVAILGIAFNLAGIALGFFSPLAFSAVVISWALLLAIRDYSSQAPLPRPAAIKVAPTSLRYPLAA